MSRRKNIERGFRWIMTEGEFQKKKKNSDQNVEDKLFTQILQRNCQNNTK